MVFGDCYLVHHLRYTPEMPPVEGGSYQDCLGGDSSDETPEINIHSNLTMTSKEWIAINLSDYWHCDSSTASRLDIY